VGVFRSARGGPSRNDLVARGLILIAFFVGLILLMAASLKGAFADTSPVSTRLDTAGGSIGPGSDVKLGGLIVGRVKAISGGAGGVTLDLTMDNELIDGIPSDVEARILPATVFGTTYVDLTGGHLAGGRHLRAGDVIEQDTSVPTLELQKALDSIDRLVDALGPAELNTALSAVAGALDGRGEQLGRTIRTLNDLLRKVTPTMPLVREDLNLLATNLETVSKAAPDLLDAVDDGLYVGAHLVKQKADLTRLLTGGTALVRDADRFLEANDKKLVRLVNTAVIVSDAFYDRRGGLVDTLLAINNVSGKIQTVGNGGPAKVDGVLVDAGRYSYYTRADCPRYGNARGGNCGGAGRAAVGGGDAGALVAGSLTRGGRR
jgi:phospholipid/cholesterol/gamma-HCH transport system substrate-binding protein